MTDYPRSTLSNDPRLYFYEIALSLASYTWAETVQVLRYNLLETDEEDILVYRLRISMPGGGILEMRERIVSSKKTLQLNTTAYSFHWQDQHGNLIRRWDNAPHFRDLNDFPHHIHIGEPETVIPGKPIQAIEMLAEIDAEINHFVERPTQRTQ
jgi:hypothetical protein